MANFFLSNRIKLDQNVSELNKFDLLWPIYLVHFKMKQPSFKLICNITEDNLNYYSEIHICVSVCSAKYIFSSLFKQVTDQIESLEEACKHMEVAMKLFKTYEETADADPSMVTDQYLDPLHLMLEMPDMSRLEKPAKPPMPSLVRMSK